MVSFEAPRITVSLVTWYLLLFVPVIPQLNFSCIFNLKLQLLFICSVISDFLQSRGLQHVRLYPGASSNSCLLSQQCHPIISSSVVPFSSCLQSFTTSASFLMNKANQASLLEECFLTSISYEAAVKKWSEDDQTSNHLMERICKVSP